MSFYGKVRRIGSQQFQFDRIYKTRSDMEANCATDGVSIGRYVLVEYGQRYEPERNENGEIVYIEDDNGNPTDRHKLIERESFKENREIDANQFGNTYDSTVWQKIYIGTESNLRDLTGDNTDVVTEKYIMVAELNATLPQLEVDGIAAMTYSESTDPELDLGIYDMNNVFVQGIEENLNQPYFDMQQDTELVYKMHSPQPLKLNVQEKNINYNQLGFDVAYSPAKVEDVKDEIHWTTDDFDSTQVPQNLPFQVSSKTLRMNLPSFGNTIKDIYDLLYGMPSEENGVRPYFEPYWNDAKAADEASGADVDRSIGKDPEEWLNNVPSLSDLLKNNKIGLAGILQSLFGTGNPLTGYTKYWLLSHWIAEFDENEMGENTPAIIGKPEIVTYKTYNYHIPYYDDQDIFYNVSELNTMKTEKLTQLSQLLSQENPDQNEIKTLIDEIQTILKNLVYVNMPTLLKVANGTEYDENKTYYTLNTNGEYQLYEYSSASWTDGTRQGKIFLADSEQVQENGDYYVDFSTWNLRSNLPSRLS